MMTTLGTVVLVSLLGSLHCAGMCGPLVAVAVGDSRVRTHAARGLLQGAYHGGRLLTYTAVGSVCGLLGAGLNWGGSLVGLQRTAALLVGGVMVAAEVVGVLRYSGARLPRFGASTFIQRWVVLGQRVALRMRPLPRAAVIGLLTAFLSCGWLYMFAVVAASTGSPFGGGAVMASFWLGSVPILGLLGISVQAFAGTFGKRVPLATSLLVIFLGLYTIFGRLAIPAAAFEATVPSRIAPTTLEQVEAAGHLEPPWP
ncbi:MAG: sulfite exporter TauE/SafE family protein [Pirellulaceae bacterium]